MSKDRIDSLEASVRRLQGEIGALRGSNRELKQKLTALEDKDGEITKGQIVEILLELRNIMFLFIAESLERHGRGRHNWRSYGGNLRRLLTGIFDGDVATWLDPGGNEFYRSAPFSHERRTCD